MLSHPFGMQIEIGKHRAVVASIAADLVEGLETAALLSGQRVRISGTEAIERAVHRHERPLERCNRLSELRCINGCIWTKGVPKQLDVLRNVPQPRHHVIHSRILGVGRTSQFF